jgi:TrmH family RNA methyltransferase
LGAIGNFPAEWDLIVQGRKLETLVDRSEKDSPAEAGLLRPYIPGLMAYAEDIRSPFNLGSIFRTAEAFGAERLFLSPLCTPPEHPRAVRSSMGCIDYLPWERKSLEDLPSDIPVFALETGGTPIEEFDFPPKGIVIIGSEELGVSPEALERADYGRVSIPMRGIKASLNVGVAFGILMQAWSAYLPCSVMKAR